MAEPTERRLPGSVPTAHRDTFARDALPPASLWPVMAYDGAAELAYQDRLTCATERLERASVRGRRARVVFHAPGHAGPQVDLVDRSGSARTLADRRSRSPGRGQSGGA